MVRKAEGVQWMRRKVVIRGEKSEGPDHGELGKPAKATWVLVQVKKDSTRML